MNNLCYNILCDRFLISYVLPSFWPCISHMCIQLIFSVLLQMLLSDWLQYSLHCMYSFQCRQSVATSCMVAASLRFLSVCEKDLDKVLKLRPPQLSRDRNLEFKIQLLNIYGSIQPIKLCITISGTVKSSLSDFIVEV